MKKSDLIEKVKRRLGHPLIKIELDDRQIIDHIDYTRSKFIKWAIGNATSERYFTLMLSGGVSEYELPSGVTEVIGYSSSSAGSVNTLFSMENYLYNQGMFNQMLMREGTGGAGYTMISYHIARDFLETVKRYIVDQYNFRYDRYKNTLILEPSPPEGGVIILDGIEYDSPGFILIRSYMVTGDDEDLYNSLWILDYVTAMCKVSLGRIRSKFANFTAIGSTTGLSLDGDSLISEGKEEIDSLEESLREQHVYEGWGIEIG